MCLSFYYQDSETFKRYYLLRYVENHQNFKNKKFWENYLSGLINLDIDSNNKEESGQDINYIIFSNIISVTKSMSDFHLGKEFINDFLEDITKSKYNLNEEQKIQINYMIADNEFGSLNENDRSTYSTEICELNRSFTINYSIDNSDNNIFRPSINNSRISNFLNDNIRNSNISNNMNISNDNNLNMNNNSNIINENNKMKISNDNNLNMNNNSNLINVNNKINNIDSNNESDDGSIESIEIEEMNKNS